MMKTSPLEGLDIRVSSLSYFVFSGASSFNVGAYLILTSWLAVELTGDAKLASSLFLVSLVVGLVLANVAGVISRPEKTRTILYLSNIIKSLTGLYLVVALLMDYRLDVSLLVFVVFRTFGNAFLVTSGAVAFQQCFSEDVRAKRIAEIGVVRQIGIAIGTGAAGISIISFGQNLTATLLFLITLMQSFLISTFAVNAPGNGEAELLGWQSFTTRLIDGFKYIRSERSIFLALLIMAITLSVAQLTNVMVPVFVMNDLTATVDLYGALEMVWAIGGISILVAIRFLLSGPTSISLALLFLACSGFAMVGFANSSAYPILLVFYFILGGLFNATRLISDSKIMTDVDSDMIGRVRGVSQLIANIVGIAIFTVPWVYDTTRVKGIYISWGIMIVMLSVLMSFWHTRMSDVSANGTV